MRSLPLACWPQADRDTWQQACRPHVRLSRGGAAAGMKPVTQADLARRYGYFLDHLVKEAELAVHRRRRWRATQLRNGLMLALLALHPIRSKNFAALTLSRS